MIAVIVALCVFFVVVVMVELLSRAPKRTAGASAPEQTGPEQVEDSHLVPLASVTSYWEESYPGWWRLWNYDRKNLGLVAQQDTHVLWRVFTTYLFPSHRGYGLVELEDLLEMGIRSFAVNELTPTIEGRVGSVEEARQRVESTISYIRREHGRVSS